MTFSGRTIVGVALVVAITTAVLGQSPKKPNAATTRQLDLEAQKAEADYLKSLSDLAQSYEESGDKAKTEAMLKAILKIRPDAEPVKAKLKELEEAVFVDQQEVVDLDTGKGWITTGVYVAKGERVRIEAIGSYKLIVNDELGPEGYRSEDGKGADFFDGAPTGSLIGVIVPPGGQPGKKKDGPQPFLIGSKKELDPQAAGLLVMRVNAPANAKCVGKLKVRLSGNISTSPQ
ncbi:MAG: hypothetical protein KDA69_16865 [Planctomycetaceae bacterium]|nr:hypothetical protein [Planctomycetaceae bacterium]MCA9046002.1 hypothetical protein [Planctomycetaceae bacterium]MCB9954000.1 hypothetical protein [Planctomycetaceae bacterium]